MNRSKEIGQLEFIGLVASILLLTALAIDIMLPAFDGLRDHFDLESDSTATAQIVTFFFLGQIGQIIFGPLSDRYGRLPILRAGFALYILASIIAAFSPSLNLILAARFVVGLGAAAMMVSTVASVRDRFVGDKMARIMSLVLTIFLFVPVIAPILGVAILSVTSWQAVFLTPPVGAVAVLAWSFRLKESLAPEKRIKLDIPTLLESVRQVGRNRIFVHYTTITTILFGALSSYVGSSERIIGEIYGQPELFVWIFSAVGLTMAVFSFLNAYLVERFGARRSVRTLIIIYLLVAIALLSLTLTAHGTPSVYLFFAFVAVLQGLNVAIEPNSSALAMESLGSNAGMAAAVYGTSFFVFGSMMGSLIDRLLIDTATPLAAGYAVAGLLSVGLVYSAQTRLTGRDIPAEPLPLSEIQSLEG